MPNIPVYNPQLPEINPGDRAAESWQVAARHIGSIGRESAETMRTAGNAFAKDINDFGEKLQKHQDFADQLNGTKALSEMTRQHDEDIQKIASDPNITPEQLPVKLAELYHQHQQQIDQFTGAYNNSSNDVKKWALGESERMRTRTQLRYEADTAHASDMAINSTLKGILGNAAADNPGGVATTFDLDNKIANLDNVSKSFDNYQYFNLQTRNEFQKRLDAAKSSLVGHDVFNMIDKDPSRLDDLMKKYGPYLTPEHQTALYDHARTAQKRADGDQAKGIANGIINDFIGNGAPAGNAQPMSGDLWGRIKGAEHGLDNSGNALVSPKGAIGISQIMPETAKSVAGELGVPYDEQRLHTDQKYNESLGQRYLQDQLNTYGGNEALAAAAYNAGPGRVDKWLETIGDPRKGPITNQEWASRIPIDETRRYTLGIIGNGKPNLAAMAPRLPSPVSPAEASGAVGVGDSISAGLIRHGGIAGKENRTKLLDWSNGATAAGGSPPSMILDNIKNLPDETFAGKNIVLSSGASNAPGVKDSDVQAIKDQIAFLKDKGANVVLLGVGNKASLAGWNDKLGEIAKDTQVKFAGPLANTGDGVHPSNPLVYKELAHSLPFSGGSQAEQFAANAAQPTGAGANNIVPVGATAQPAPSAGADQQQQAAPAKPAPKLKPFPSREDMLSRIPSNVSPDQRSIIERGIDEARTELLKRTEEERSALGTEINGGLEKLKNGFDYDYNEDTIKHYFEPKSAQKIIENLKDASAVGQQIGQIRQTPISDVLSTMQTLNDSLKITDPANFVEHHKMVIAYQEAAKKHLEGLGMWPGQKDPENADPVNYLINIDPDLRQKYLDTDKGDPAAVSNFASSMLAKQAELGVPAERQRVLSNGDAQSQTHKIIADPAQAANVLKGLQNLYGDSYNQAFSDLVTHGKMPEAYMLMGSLKEPKDQWLLARGLSEQQTASKKGNENFWKDAIGEQTFNQIQKAIRDNTDYQKVVNSFMNSGADGNQVKGLHSAIDTLAFAKYAYEAKGDPGGAAAAALKSAIGDYQFIGSARVPAQYYDAAYANSRNVLQSVALDTVSFPPGYGDVGQPSRESYLAQVRALPQWNTTAKEDGMVLTDKAGRAVRDTNGAPFMVKFADKADSGATADNAMPYGSPY